MRSRCDAAAFVDDLDDHRRVAGLLQDRGRRSSRHPHARLGIDVHREQHPWIQPLLKRLRIAALPGPQQIAAQIGRHRRAEILERLDEPLDVGRQRLSLDRHRRQHRFGISTGSRGARCLTLRDGDPRDRAGADCENESRIYAIAHARHCRQWGTGVKDIPLLSSAASGRA